MAQCRVAKSRKTTVWDCGLCAFNRAASTEAIAGTALVVRNSHTRRQVITNAKMATMMIAATMADTPSALMLTPHKFTSNLSDIRQASIVARNCIARDD